MIMLCHILYVQLSDRYIIKLPLYSIVRWFGKHSLDFDLDQMLGFIYYCGQSTYAAEVKLFMGIIITIISAAFMYWLHEFFYKTLLIRVNDEDSVCDRCLGSVGRY